MTQEPIDEVVSDPAPRAIPRGLPALRALWPWLLLTLVAIFGWRELRQVDLIQVRNLLRVTSTAVIALLLAGTAANLALGGYYDVAALGGRSLPPSRTRRWSVGVIAFAWSNSPDGRAARRPGAARVALRSDGRVHRARAARS
jgi:hypothetical protein